MATVLHELATIAAKYGALSTKHGVLIRWKPRLNRHRLRPIEWLEFGGPPVAAPDKAVLGEYKFAIYPYEFGVG